MLGNTKELETSFYKINFRPKDRNRLLKQTARTLDDFLSLLTTENQKQIIEKLLPLSVKVLPQYNQFKI